MRAPARFMIGIAPQWLTPTGSAAGRAMRSPQERLFRAPITSPRSHEPTDRAGHPGRHVSGASGAECRPRQYGSAPPEPQKSALFRLPLAGASRPMRQAGMLTCEVSRRSLTARETAEGAVSTRTPRRGRPIPFGPRRQPSRASTVLPRPKRERGAEAPMRRGGGGKGEKVGEGGGKMRRERGRERESRRAARRAQRDGRELRAPAESGGAAPAPADQKQLHHLGAGPPVLVAKLLDRSMTGRPAPRILICASGKSSPTTDSLFFAWFCATGPSTFFSFSRHVFQHRGPQQHLRLDPLSPRQKRGSVPAARASRLLHHRDPRSVRSLAHFSLAISRWFLPDASDRVRDHLRSGLDGVGHAGLASMLVLESCVSGANGSVCSASRDRIRPKSPRWRSSAMLVRHEGCPMDVLVMTFVGSARMAVRLFKIPRQATPSDEETAPRRVVAQARPEARSAGNDGDALCICHRAPDWPMRRARGAGKASGGRRHRAWPRVTGTVLRAARFAANSEGHHAE